MQFKNIFKKENVCNFLKGKDNKKVPISGVVVAMAGLFVAGWYTMEHINVTITPSLKNTIFYTKDVTDIKDIKKDEYVIFNMDPSFFKQFKKHKKNESQSIADNRITKRVGCDSGDILRVDSNKYYYCNEIFLGKAKDKTLLGEDLPNFVYNGVIPKDMIFVAGEHKDSLDSKYIGFISKKEVLKIARPLI